MFTFRKKPQPKPFVIADNDPLAAEHAVVTQWLDEATPPSPQSPSRIVDLKDTEAGRTLLQAAPATARRYVLALIAQAHHWETQAQNIHSQLAEEEQLSVYFHPTWHRANSRKELAIEALLAILRRRLPLERGDILTITDWIMQTNAKHIPTALITYFIKACGWYLADNPVTPDLRTPLLSLTDTLLGSFSKHERRQGARLRQLITNPRAVDETELSNEPSGPSAAEPAPAGSAGVLVELKEHLGLLGPQEGVRTEEIGPDAFPLRTDSPLRSEHALLTKLLEEVVGTTSYYDIVLRDLRAGRKIASLDMHGRGRLLLAAAERAVHGHLAGTDYELTQVWQSRYAANSTFNAVLSEEHLCDREALFDLVLFMTAIGHAPWLADTHFVSHLICQAEAEAAISALSPGERHVLHRLRARLVQAPPLGQLADNVSQLTRLIGDGAVVFLVPGEAWTDTVNTEMATLPACQRTAWRKLFSHALTATSGRPSAKWLKSAGSLLEAVGHDKFAEALLRWLPVVASGRSGRLLCDYLGDSRDVNSVISEDNASILKGLVWMVPLVSSSDLTRAMGALAVTCYKKIPGVGPRAVKVGNAAVYALSQVDGSDAIGQLAMLRVKVKFGTAQKELDKALAAVAERSGVSREDVEELGIPSYGFKTGGIRVEVYGNSRAELQITNSQIVTTWFNDKGKPVKNPPAEVKRTHADDLKELKAAAIDAEKMLPAQRERIDQLHLSRKTWPLGVWRERYLDHPLVGTIARRLIWRFRQGDHEADGVFCDGQLVGHDDKPIAGIDGDATVALWHPIGNEPATIMAWRSWLEEHEVRQPFKQAHREVYLLTDAERATGVYSNRFAAHIIRQHQFNALCGARGWKNKLRLMVDDEYPPAMRLLPPWNLRAEFWIEGIGTEYGQDTNDTGTFLRLSTDQVRFYPLDATQRTGHAWGGGYYTRGPEGSDQPIPLDQIPALVFSEIMRDVDLFVGVASVGNDPTWADGGPGGRYRDYWTGYAFGELSESAKSRHQVLERLIPRLSIADRCSFSDRFLIVRGDLRTYKIHLGSGNILMEPNDQYLCIVKAPDREGKRVFLPFEGDQTLAIILSKAFLLAADGTITDTTILGQIRC